jgi:hypothetical protein
MKPFLAAFSCLLACQTALGPALAAEDDSVAALLKERLEVRAQVDKINQDAFKANGALQTKKYLMGDILTAAKGPAPTAAQLEQWKSSAEMFRQQAESARLNLAAIERKLELVQITDPAIRTEKIKNLEAASAKIDKQLQEANAPIQKKVEALNAPLRKTDAAFAAALEKFFKDGSGDFAAAKRGKATWFSGGSGQIHWQGADQKDVAWGSIFLQARDVGNFPGTKIDGTYPVVNSFSQGNFKNIWISVGNFKLCINVYKAEWGHNEAALIDLAKNLVDLKGLNSLGSRK